MRVMLDCDGVIADFNTAAYHIHQRSDPYEDPANHGNYSIQKIWGITTEEFTAPMGYDFWANVPLTVHATKIVAILESAFGRENICILTKPTDTEGACDGKRAWIKKNFPNYAGRYLIGPDKTFNASPDTVLVDDYIKNCKAFIGAGGRAYLLPAAWNIKHDVDPIQDLMGFIGTIFSNGWGV